MNATDIEELTLDEELNVIHQICSTILFVGGIVINPLCMTAIFKAKIQHTISSIFLINILVNNLLLTFIPILSALVNFYTTINTETDAVCKSIGFISNILVEAELAGLAFISLNFYSIIVPENPLRSFFSKHRNIVILILSSYVMASILPTFPLFGILGSYSRGSGGIYCSSFRDSNYFGRVTTVIIFGVLLTILISTYCGILYVVRQSQRAIAASESLERPNKAGHVRKNTEQHERNVDTTYIRRNYDRHLIKSFSLMVLSFLILYLPLTISIVMDPTGKSWSEYGILIVSYIACSHCMVNSLVYTLTNRKLRNTLVSLLCSYSICIQAER